MALDPLFANWKLISTTDRGDNNTFRFIMGNDVAYAAAQSGNVPSWPDGTLLAEIGWPQALDKDGLIHPGKFIQVEMMVKNAHRYKATDGWAWGRWRGPDLRPNGDDAHFVDECTGCHVPVRRNDYVYTLPITAAHVNPEQVVNNAGASLPGTVPWQPLGWGQHGVCQPQTHTTATLYAHDAAKQVLQVGAKPSLAHSPGSVRVSFIPGHQLNVR